MKTALALTAGLALVITPLQTASAGQQRYYRSGIVAPRYTAPVRSYSAKRSYVAPKTSYRAAALANTRYQSKYNPTASARYQYKYNSSVAARNFAYANRAVVNPTVRVQPAYRNYNYGNRYVTRAVPYATYRNWDRRHDHSWNHHRYRWSGNSWVILGGGYAPFYSYDNDYYSEPYVTSVVPSYDTSDSLGAEVQQALAERGYYHDSIDGDVGPNTRAAIAAYQRDQGLTVTGTINAPLLDSLDLE